jgi:hypothetical protein
MVALAVASSIGHAQDGVPYLQPSPTSELTVQAVSDHAKPTNGKPFVVTQFKQDAREEKAANWPATFFGSYLVAGKPYFCTATVVGSRTLITAAHCVAVVPTVTIRRGPDKWVATCQRISGYTTDWPAPCDRDGQCPTSADYALCFIDPDKNNSPPPQLARHERLNIETTPVAVGGILKLLGFGCTDKSLTGGSSMEKDVLTGGWARITGLPAPGYNYIKTEWTLQGAAPPAYAGVSGGANICPGDSGGAVYLSGKESPNVRSIVALASRVKTAGDQITGPSFLSATSTPAARAFFDAWAKKTDLCGVKSNHASCRQE